MVKAKIRTGKIAKVIHVRFDGRKGGVESDLDRCDGYGILQGTDGQDVFFVDTALQDARFADLKAGHEALYLMENGPLRRAAKVWVTTSRTQIRDQGGESDALNNRSDVAGTSSGF